MIFLSTIPLNIGMAQVISSNMNMNWTNCVDAKSMDIADNLLTDGYSGRPGKRQKSVRHAAPGEGIVGRKESKEVLRKQWDKSYTDRSRTRRSRFSHMDNMLDTLAQELLVEDAPAAASMYQRDCESITNE